MPEPINKSAKTKESYKQMQKTADIIDGKVDDYDSENAKIKEDKMNKKKMKEWLAGQPENVIKALEELAEMSVIKRELLRPETAETGKTVTEKMFGWMGEQPENTMLDICEMQFEILKKLGGINADYEVKKSAKKMLDSLIESVKYYWLISKKIDPKTEKKIGVYDGTDVRTIHKKMYLEKLKSRSKKGSKIRRKVEMLGPKIIDFLAEGVSYSGIVKMLWDKHEIEISKAWVGIIVTENKWDKIVKERKLKLEKPDEKKREEDRENLKDDELMTLSICHQID